MRTTVNHYFGLFSFLFFCCCRQALNVANNETRTLCSFSRQSALPLKTRASLQRYIILHMFIKKSPFKNFRSRCEGSVCLYQLTWVQVG
jgi:hypothetical protein